MSFDRDLLRRIVEGALLAAGEPLSRDKLMSLFLDDDEQPEKEDLLAAIESIQADCEGRGYELKEVGSGWRFQVVEDVAPWVNRLWEEKPQKYSRAMLETLALIAYRQPITRGDIEEIRGVAVSSHIIKTLTERDWIKVVGHRDVPGRPSLYATTRQFLDYFNLKSLDELPTLSEISDLDKLNAELDFEADKNLEAAGVATENQDAAEAVSEDASSAEDGVDAQTAEAAPAQDESEGVVESGTAEAELEVDRDPNELSYEEALAEERRENAAEENDDSSSEEALVEGLENDGIDASDAQAGEDDSSGEGSLEEASVEDDSAGEGSVDGGAADADEASAVQQDYSQFGSSLFGDVGDDEINAAEAGGDSGDSEEAADVSEKSAEDDVNEPALSDAATDEDNVQPGESSGKSLFDTPLD